MTRDFCKAIPKAAVKCLTHFFLTPVNPLIAIAVDETASAAIDSAEGQARPCGRLSDAYIRKMCSEVTNIKSGHLLEMLTAIVSICLANINTFTQVYDAGSLSEKLSSSFLKQHEKQYEEKELYFINRNLSIALEECIHEIEITLENDPVFQVAWKSFFDNRLRELERDHQKLTKQVNNHEERITAQEKQTRSMLCQVAELYDVYYSKWDEALFLDDEIILSSVYQLPQYEENNEDLHEQLQNTIDLCNDVTKRMLLILGHPGSGKSTLLTYVLNNCRIATNRRIRVYRFSGFEGINWNSNIENLPQHMLNCLGLKKEDLSDSVLMLDGLDEIDMRSGHEELLEEINKQWVKAKNIHRFSLFITCRRNRIETPNSLPVRNVSLSPFNYDQITIFTKTYCTQRKHGDARLAKMLSSLANSEDSLRDILGIPLILYLTLALDVEIAWNSSLEGIYSQIFSLTGANSIYYRRSYDHQHPITSIEADKIHLFSKKIAEKMWEINPSEAVIKKKLYTPIVAELVGEGKDELRKILIGQYFMEGSDGNELLFVHRSMFEYFVALSLFDSIKKIFETGLNPEELIKKADDVLSDFSCIVGLQNLASYPEIQQHLQSMLIITHIADASWWRSFFSSFLNYGLSDCATGRRKGGKIGLKEELNRFYNIIWLTREQLFLFDETAPIEIEESFPESTLLFVPYEEIIDLHGLDLKGIKLLGRDLSEAVFWGADLEKADFTSSDLAYVDFHDAQLNDALFVNASLSGTILDGANLRGAHLCNADLSDSSLYGADLRSADLSGVDLSNADLRSANLMGANLTGANLSGANLSNAVFQKANLSNAHLDGLELSGIDFSHALFVDSSMKNVVAKDACFFDANMKGANLSNSELSGSDLTDVVLDTANLNEAFLIRCKCIHTDLTDADITGVTFNYSVFKKADLKKCIADNSYFISTIMEDVDLRGGSFTNSNFSKAKLINIKVLPGTFSSVISESEDWERWSLNEERYNCNSFFGDCEELYCSSFDHDDMKCLSDDKIPREILESYQEFTEDELQYF